MDKVDLVFPVLGKFIPVDHGYPLFGALSRKLPIIHEESAGIRFANINGAPLGKGLLQVTSRSRFRLRLLTSQIRETMVLANKVLDVASHRIRLGVPSVSVLTPADRLFARFVTLKNSTDPDPFLLKVRERLAEMGVRGEPSIPLHFAGPRAGETHRKVLRISGKSVIGYPLILDALTAEDSIRLQCEGLGGRQSMGAGFFLPLTGDETP